MATNTAISNAAAIAMLDTLVDRLDLGSGAGYIEIRTGSPPASLADASTGTLLGTLALSDPAFGAAVNDAGNHRAKATASAIANDVSADATGTAGWFRAFDSNALAHIQGTVGTATADMILNTVTLTAADIIAVTSWIVYMPDGSD